MNQQVLINQVYRHLPFKDSFSVHRGNVTVLVTPMPLEGCHAYLHMNADSYSGRLPGLNILFLHEPIVVLPGHYSHQVWQHFDYILTHYNKIIEIDTTKFRKVPFPRTTFINPPPITEDQKERTNKYPLENRLNAICMVNGNKRSLVPGELYSKRLEAALWFHLYSDLPFDVYGNPPFNLPNYKGILPKEVRFETIARYKYYFCLENIDHPIYSVGYVDKIYDCLETRTLPIYLGAPDVEKYIPPGCFINFRKFKNYRELDKYLQNLDDQTYLEYIRNIDQWVAQGGLRPLSMYAIHEYIVDLLISEKRIPPLDFFGESSEWSPDVTPELKEHRWNPVTDKTFWTYECLSQAHSPLMDYDKEKSAITTSNRHYLKKIGYLRQNNNSSKASQELEKLFLNGTFNSELVYQQAQLFIDMSRFEESRNRLKQVLMMNPCHSLALNDLGGLCMLKKDYVKAVELLHAALSNNVRNNQALENLISLLLSLNFKDYLAELIQKLTPLRAGDNDFLAILKKYNLTSSPENNKSSVELKPIPEEDGSLGHGIC